MVLEHFGQVTSAYYKFFNKDGAVLDAASKEFRSKLLFIEEELVKRGTKFFGGEEKPMMLDFLIWPWMDRAEAMNEMVGKDRVKVDMETFPKMVRNEINTQDSEFLLVFHALFVTTKKYSKKRNLLKHLLIFFLLVLMDFILGSIHFFRVPG